jgi:hypothetical protein
VSLPSCAGRLAAESRAADRQQPQGHGIPIIAVAPMLLGIAKLDVSITDVPAHVATEAGGPIGMSGLMPGAVPPEPSRH